ncbi:uncharacterized protein LOC129971514 [Argiope bruennichi]|uniref:uncharacterized protein LOC129971514 n=1 Tax=Argiope bruennichi TaxID=94029 RepID=UPI002495452F|nr:uncharacterized protein LOC129971514 [Argiope bruennichi]XP_055941323.1 uncharacterized protein LOC129971514 [Argiope bruennichi]
MLEGSPNRQLFIHMHDYFFSGDSYIQIYEYMPMDLRKYLRQSDIFSMTDAKKILRQLLLALCQLQEFSIIHADLKPENLVIDDRTLTLKVIDFGGSHFTFQLENHTKIATRSYRAPEVILGAPYGLPIDMWAFGCIAGEMLTNRILYPGDTNSEMLAMFEKSHRVWDIDLLESGRLTLQFFCKIGGQFILQDSQADDQVGPLNRIAFSIPDHKFTSKEMLQRIHLSEIVKGCLALNPSSRMKPNIALDADFFKADESKDWNFPESQEVARERNAARGPRIPSRSRTPVRHRSRSPINLFR